MKTIENTVQDQVVESEMTFATTVELAARAVAFDDDSSPNHRNAAGRAAKPKIKRYETVSYGCLREWARPL